MKVYIIMVDWNMNSHSSEYPAKVFLNKQKAEKSAQSYSPSGSVLEMEIEDPQHLLFGKLNES